MSRSTREKSRTTAEKDTLTALKNLHGTIEIPDKDRLIDEIYRKRREPMILFNTSALIELLHLI